jgi:cytochrome b subunit of formate dehydrogenase
MKPKRADYLNFAKAGLIVAAAMGLVFLIALRLPGLDEFTREALGLLLFLPSGALFLPFIHNIHTYWAGYVYLGIAANWLSYTWGTWAFMEKRRRKRELRRTQPSADVVPPDRLPADPSAK